MTNSCDPAAVAAELRKRADASFRPDGKPRHFNYTECDAELDRRAAATIEAVTKERDGATSVAEMNLQAGAFWAKCAKAERDARESAELGGELFLRDREQAKTTAEVAKAGWRDAETALVAVKAERDALRESLLLTAGVAQAVGQQHMATTITFTGKWAHLGMHRISDILDRADAALSIGAGTSNDG